MSERAGRSQDFEEVQGARLAVPATESEAHEEVEFGVGAIDPALYILEIFH